MINQNYICGLKCRLCSGSITKVFSKIILGKYDAGYYKCIDCLSLQTEPPYWLDEAYDIANLSNTDTGAAQRNINNLTASFVIAKLISAKNIIDIGGGDGLLCRLLRDYKFNCYVKDKYAHATYSQGFQNEDFDIPDLIIGFEVLEHYPDPILDLEDMFSKGSPALLISTEVYKDQDQDWWYLSPETGQHVFFYSVVALNYIAKNISTI